MRGVLNISELQAKLTTRNAWEPNRDNAKKWSQCRVGSCKSLARPDMLAGLAIEQIGIGTRGVNGYQIDPICRDRRPCFPANSSVQKMRQRNVAPSCRTLYSPRDGPAGGCCVDSCITLRRHFRWQHDASTLMHEICCLRSCSRSEALHQFRQSHHRKLRTTPVPSCRSTPDGRVVA
jgi:hypothetical protein